MSSEVEALKDLRRHRDDLMLNHTTSEHIPAMLDRVVRTFDLPFTTTVGGIKYTRKQSYELLLRALTEL